MLAQVHTGGKNRARSAGRPRRRRRVRLARSADSRFLPIGIIEAPVFPSARRRNREDRLGAPRFPRSKARDRDGIPFSKTHVDTLREKTGIVGRVSEHHESRCARRGAGTGTPTRSRRGARRSGGGRADAVATGGETQRGGRADARTTRDREAGAPTRGQCAIARAGAQPEEAGRTRAAGGALTQRAVKAARLASVACGTCGLHQGEQRIGVAIVAQLDQLLHVSAGRALMP